MRKRVQVDNNLKELLDSYSSNNKTNNKKIRFSLMVNFFVVIIVIFMSIFLFKYIMKTNDLNNKIKKLESKLYVYKIDSVVLDNILNGNDVSYVQDKLNFLDKNIVFVIDGYGDYYYSYDCMMKKVKGNYTYWAFNKDQAIAKGYMEGSC